MLTPNSSSKRRAMAPTATRAAVSRALERSRIGRTSSRPYFTVPARSAWPGRIARQPLDLGLDRVDRHAHLPVRVLPVLVLDPQADRAAHRQAVAHAADDLGEVGLDLLALAAAVALLAPAQVLGDVVLGDRQAGRHALDDDEQALAVRFAGGQESKLPIVL